MIEKIYLKTLLFLIDILDYGNKRGLLIILRINFLKKKSLYLILDLTKVIQ